MKLAIQKSINVFFSIWHQLWQYRGKLFSSCIYYHRTAIRKMAG